MYIDKLDKGDVFRQARHTRLIYKYTTRTMKCKLEIRYLAIANQTRHSRQLYLFMQNIQRN